jgi:hypothetical protein
MRGERIKIDGHYYTSGVWYPSKEEAQDKANRLRKTGMFKGVRIVRTLADRRYAQYWIYTR